MKINVGEKICGFNKNAEVEAESEAVEAANFRGSGSYCGKILPLPLWPFTSNVKNLNVVQFLGGLSL